MKYIKVKFTLGLDCEAYQEIANNTVQCYKDLDGNLIDVPLVIEAYVLDAEPEFPVWGIPD